MSILHRTETLRTFDFVRSTSSVNAVQISEPRKSVSTAVLSVPVATLHIFVQDVIEPLARGLEISGNVSRNSKMIAVPNVGLSRVRVFSIRMMVLAKINEDDISA